MQEKSKTLSQLLALFIVIILIIPMYYFYKSNKNNLIVNNDLNIKNNTSNKDNTAELNFLKKKILADNYNSIDKNNIYNYISIPQLKSVNDALMDNNINIINKTILDDFNGVLCPNIEDSNDIEEVYQKAIDINNQASTSNKIKTSPDDEYKLKVINKAGISTSWNATTTMLNKNIFSLSINVQSYCGGAHPSSYAYGMNYFINKNNSISTNSKIELKDLFSDYDKDKISIGNIISDTINKSYDPIEQKECVTDINKNYNSGILEYLSFSLDKDGIRIISIGLSHAMAACEPYGVSVAYDILDKYINPKFKDLLK